MPKKRVWCATVKPDKEGQVIRFYNLSLRKFNLGKHALRCEIIKIHLTTNIQINVI